MTADVYAGDDDLNRVGPAAADPILTIIRVRADADPDVLFRIAAQLNRLNRAPVRFALDQGAEDDVHVEAHIAGCTESSIDLVCRQIERLTCVYEVTRQSASRLDR